MDDSDDYLLDDIVLDDQALAVLDQEERKYLDQSSLSDSSTPIEHIAKRQKTANGWSPGIVSKAYRDPGDDDDLPEISLRGDGSYSVGGTSSGMVPRVRQHPINTRQYSPAKALFSAAADGGSSVLLSNLRPQELAPRFSNSSLIARPMQPPSNSVVSRGMLLNGHSKTAPEPNLLQQQVLELQRKLDELREENAKVQSALKEAVEVKLAKEGEVSVLRKNIEKTSQNHASQIAQLKAEKDKTEAKQIQMQKEMKDEMERLRTQFLFKQQELESSIRRVPVSVRAKKTSRDFPSTPIATSSAMRDWNGNVSQHTMSRISFDETPVRPSRPAPPVFKSSPTKQVRRSPEKIKKPALPGFQNAFETSTLARSPSKKTNKGKTKMESTISLDQIELPFGYSQPIISAPSQLVEKSTKAQQGYSFTHPKSSAPSGPEETQVTNDEMDVVGAENEDVLMEEDLYEPINWKPELCRIILTHSHSLSDQITFQHLLGISQMVKDPQKYSSACARILEVMASSTLPDAYEDSLKVVCPAFLLLLSSLLESKQVMSLIVLLNLMETLVLSLPAFQTVILAARLTAVEGPVLSVIDLLQMLLKDQMSLSDAHAHLDGLADETMNLLELLCFHPSPESLRQLEGFAHHRDLLLNLLHADRKPAFLERSSRVLVLLATNHELWEALLGSSSGQTEDVVKDALVERLCAHLVDVTRSPTDTFKTNILIYFAQLSISHPSAHITLVGTSALIPSLILYISGLSSPLWEDDGQHNASKQAISLLIESVNQAMFLLYHLIFGIEPCLNLRSKLHIAGHQRLFNCINHVFTVTFGRLSYCDPPSWLGAELHQEMELISETAREILELVIDGPEGDSVWVAFQFEPDEDSAIDEEEMEARLIG